MQNIQTVNKLIAREHNIQEDIVESVNSFYWKSVRKSLSSFENLSVSLKYIGTITISRRKINYYIGYLIRKIRKIKASTIFKETTKEHLIEVNTNKLRKALKQRDALAKQYYDENIKKFKRICKVTSDNSGELRQDIGGDYKPSEEAVPYVTRERTTGDSETQINMQSMSI